MPWHSAPLSSFTSEFALAPVFSSQRLSCYLAVVLTTSWCWDERKATSSVVPCPCVMESSSALASSACCAGIVGRSRALPAAHEGMPGRLPGVGPEASRHRPGSRGRVHGCRHTAARLPMPAQATPSLGWLRGCVPAWCPAVAAPRRFCSARRLGAPRLRRLRSVAPSSSSSEELEPLWPLTFPLGPGDFFKPSTSGFGATRLGLQCVSRATGFPRAALIPYSRRKQAAFQRVNGCRPLPTGTCPGISPCVFLPAGVGRG